MPTESSRLVVIEAICYDVFNTLVELVPGQSEPNPVPDRLGLSPDAYVAAANVYDKDLTAGFEVGLPAYLRMSKLLRDLGVSFKEDRIIEDLVQLELDWFISRFQLVAGAESTLRQLSEEFVQGLCSNTTPYGKAMMRRLGLFKLVDDRAALSCEYKRLKPDKLIYAEALRQLRSVPAKCLFVDDGASLALAGAQRFSRDLTLVLVDPNGANAADPNYPHHYVVASVAELPDRVPVLN